MRKFCLLGLILLSACTAELIDKPSEISEDEVIITATASLPECRTKMIYEDGFDGPGIKAGWKTGDTFLALEINGNSITPVTFTAKSPVGEKTSFTSKGAVTASKDTRWVAVLGKGAKFNGNSIDCSYSSQTGTLSGLENFDYMTASSTGETPDFDYGGGSHLTYLLKIKMPEGVSKVEFNTFKGSNEWSVASSGDATSCTADFKPEAAKTLTLSSPTKAEQIVYLAVPAIDYTSAGLIVTALSKDGSKSQGKVCSKNFSKKGGKVGNFDMSTLALIDRPDPKAAITYTTTFKILLRNSSESSYSGITDKYESIQCPSWAPFNLGASASPTCAEESYGEYFAWGETEGKSGSYKYDGKLESIGFTRTINGITDIPLTFREISGTKYDAARVKWGSAWRMPRLEETLIFTGSNETVTLKAGAVVTTDSGFRTYEVEEYKGVQVTGRILTHNSSELFFPYAGRIAANSSKISNVGKTGYYKTGTLNYNPSSGEAYRLYVRGNQLDYLSMAAGDAFPIRPVLASDRDYPAPAHTISGKITDTDGKGISGVCVTDGFNCCKSGSDGSYSIEANALARFISITLPSAYEIPMNSDGRPAFYQKISSTTAAPVNFTLKKRSSTDNHFTIITVADAHVKTQDNLSRFSSKAIPDIQKTISELEASGKAGTIIGMALGDQLWDNMDIANDVWKQYVSLNTSKGTMPFFYTIGNHDHEHGLRNIDFDPDYYSTAKYMNTFGPTDYSFDIGNAHIIVMDDIYYEGNDDSGKIKYKQGISGEQVHWLKQDIENVENKQNKIGIFCTHAPIFSAISNWSVIQKSMMQFKESHVLSGHIHNLTNDAYQGIKAQSGRTIVEHNIQSLSGMWWLADLSPNGAPGGYGVFTFNSDGLESEYNKITKEDKSFQMRVYSGNDSYGGYSWSGYNGKFLVRIWDGDDTDVPEDERTWWVDFVKNGNATPMTRLTEPIVDKCSAGYIVSVLHSPYGTGGSATSYSWWMIDAPCGNPANETGWEIVAKHKIKNGPESIYKTSVLSRDFTGYENDQHFKY